METTNSNQKSLYEESREAFDVVFELAIMFYNIGRGDKGCKSYAGFKQIVHLVHEFEKYIDVSETIKLQFCEMVIDAFTDSLPLYSECEAEWLKE